jgi:Bacterial tandem repeat domain 1
MSSPSSVAATLRPNVRQKLAIEALSQSKTITCLAQEYQVSCKFVRIQSDKANVALNESFEPSTPDDQVLFHLPVTKSWLFQLILGLVPICHSSLRRVVELLRDVFHLTISPSTVRSRLEAAAQRARAINAAQDLFFTISIGENYMRSNTIIRTFATWCFVASIILANSISAFADQEKYVGFWKPGAGNSKILKFDSWEEFTEEWADLAKKNMRLQDLEILKSLEGLKYIGTWTPGTGSYALLAHDNFDDFVDAWKESLDDKSKQLIDVEVIRLGDKNYYVGVWDAGKGGTAFFQYNDWDSFVSKWNELAKDNRVLIDVEAFVTGNTVNYVGIWEKGEGKNQALYQANSFEKFTDKWKELNKSDLRLADIDRVPVKGGEIFIGVWNKGTGGQYLNVFNSLSEIQAQNKNLNAKKLDLIDFAAVNFGKPIPQPKPPAGKPLYQTLYFSKGQPMKKDPVSGFDFPADMPTIKYPKFDGCNEADRKTIEKAWAKAHHHSWRVVQLFQTLDKAGSYRDDLWKAGYTAGNNIEERKKSYSPYAFFGAYKGGTYRYEYIRDAVYLNWQKRYMEKLTVKCRRKDDGGAHPCYLNNPGGGGKPPANHIVAGTINFCNDFFDDSTDSGRVKTIIHEMFHWLLPKGLAILDTHTHWDRNSKGRCRVSTDKMYKLDDVMHLATSRGCWDDPHYHQGDAARNNDTYAYFIRNFGDAVYSKKLTQFPEK